jgi:hypothetical protein
MAELLHVVCQLVRKANFDRQPRMEKQCPA